MNWDIASAASRFHIESVASFVRSNHGVTLAVVFLCICRPLIINWDISNRKGIELGLVGFFDLFLIHCQFSCWVNSLVIPRVASSNTMIYGLVFEGIAQRRNFFRKRLQIRMELNMLVFYTRWKSFQWAITDVVKSTLTHHFKFHGVFILSNCSICVYCLLLLLGLLLLLETGWIELTLSPLFCYSSSFSIYLHQLVFVKLTVLSWRILKNDESVQLHRRTSLKTGSDALYFYCAY